MTRRLIERAILRTEVRECVGCDLSGRRHTPWSGSDEPEGLVIIGETPHSQVATIQPLISDVLMPRLSYLGVVSCASQTTPRKDQVDACGRNLDAQLRFLNPRYVLVLGGVALGACLRLRADYPKADFKELRGQWWRITDESWCVATYTPAEVVQSVQKLNTFEVDVMMWGIVAKQGIEPMLNEWCIKCGKWVKGRKDGLGMCEKHLKEQRVKAEQLELMELPSTNPKRADPT